MLQFASLLSLAYHHLLLPVVCRMRSAAAIATLPVDQFAGNYLSFYFGSSAPMNGMGKQARVRIQGSVQDVACFDERGRKFPVSHFRLVMLPAVQRAIPDLQAMCSIIVLGGMMNRTASCARDSSSAMLCARMEVKMPLVAYRSADTAAEGVMRLRALPSSCQVLPFAG